MATRIQQIRDLGQAIWFDFISRDLLESGKLLKLVREGVTGVTSNPTIFQKAISTGTDYDDQIRELARGGDDARAIYTALARHDITEAADTLRPVYDETQGRDGFVSIEVDPALAHDTAGTLDEARRWFTAIDRPNVMIKVPATPEGIPAVRTLIAEGINVNVTLIFAIDAYEKVMRAYVDGLKDRLAAGKPLGIVGSVASFFVSRVDTLVDKLLDEKDAAGDTSFGGLRGQAAIANARIAYDRYKHMFEGDEFAPLRKAGARVQRPLWASTSTKNPNYPDTKYVDALIGPETVNTMPPNTLEASRDHAMPARTIDMDVDRAYATVEKLGAVGIAMAAVTDQLLAEGVRSFASSFDQLMADVEAKRARLAG